MSKEDLLLYIMNRNLDGVLSELKIIDNAKLTERVAAFRPSCLLEAIRLGYDTFKRSEEKKLIFFSQESAKNLAIMLSVIDKAGKEASIICANKYFGVNLIDVSFSLLKDAISDYRKEERGFEFNIRNVSVEKGFPKYEGGNIEFYVGLSADHLEGGQLCPHINWIDRHVFPAPKEDALIGEG